MITIEIRGEKEVIDALRDFKAESDLAIMKAFKKVGLLIQSAAKLRLKEKGNQPQQKKTGVEK